ncbi:MAG: D-aminoacylase [Acidobacteriota bacterium]
MRIKFIMLLVAVLIVSSIHPLSFSQAQNQTGSILIVGGTVIDGSGAPARRVDVRIVGDTIKAIGNLKPLPNERVVDARGMVVAPGFIDIHNHSDRGLDREPTANSQILQGITTLAVGADGGSPASISEYLKRREAQKIGVNVLTFIGHATARAQVLGEDFKRQATKEEIAKMASVIEQGMKDGAFGISTGLEYDVGFPSSTEEVVTLSKVAAHFGGIYMSHIRDEADLMLTALGEAIQIGKEAKIPVQISHIKMGTVAVWDKAAEAVKMVEAARKKGQDVTADCYPYDAWSSTITVLVPSRRHDDVKEVTKGLADVGGGANVLVTSCSAHRDYEGKTLDEIARANRTTAVEVYMQIVKDGGAGVVCRSMKESDIETFYKQKWVMVSSDGGIGMRHPRGAGTFPRVLGRFVREKKWLTLEEAIRKMTSAVAMRLGINDRGLLRKGMKADIVIFDPEKVIDQSTMMQPFAEPIGIAQVFVNGVVVVEASKVTGAVPGTALRHQFIKTRKSS